MARRSNSEDWELDEGIPQFDDQFIQQYLRGRQALIDEEKKRRHDARFRQMSSPVVDEACRIVSRIRERELKEVWTRDVDSSSVQQTDDILYPGMTFRLARARMENTDLWKIVQKMPKGALLHGHLEAMVDLDLLIDQVLALPGLHIASSSSLATDTERRVASVHLQYFSTSPSDSEGCSALWQADYEPMTYLPVKGIAEAFPNQSIQGFRDWFKSRCTIVPEASLKHHNGAKDIWVIFQRAFQIIDSIVYYEPVFRACLQRILAELQDDGVRYVEFRLAFDFQYRRDRCDTVEPDYMEFFNAFGEEIESYKTSDAGMGFYGARMIWTTLRRYSNRQIVESMKQCIETKKEFPDLIAGFDLIGPEEEGRPLADLIPVLFWFKKRCVEEGVDIPFLFHAGECLGDGDETDRNLYDAILLGTRRIGHAFSLYKHPLLVDLVKEKKILVECCPISNEVLRLTSSIMSHPLPALLSRGVAVSLCNDDPAIMGHGMNGLTTDFCQVLNGLENTGLSGLATMAENSIRWSCFEDQGTAEWLRGVKDGVAGTGVKATRLKEWYVEFERFCQWVVLEFGLDEESDDERQEEEHEEQEEQ